MRSQIGTFLHLWTTPRLRSSVKPVLTWWSFRRNKAKVEFEAVIGVKEAAEQWASEQRIHRHRLHISEILTLKCPRPDCGQVFVDFDGCVCCQNSDCVLAADSSAPDALL